MEISFTVRRGVTGLRFKRERMPHRHLDFIVFISSEFFRSGDRRPQTVGPLNAPASGARLAPMAAVMDGKPLGAPWRFCGDRARRGQMQGVGLKKNSIAIPARPDLS